MRISIVGCGELGLRVGRRLVDGGHRVHGITRTDARHEALRAAGILPGLAPVEADATLFSVPGASAQRDAMQAWPALSGRVVLVSSTAVYAGMGGRLDEQTPLLLPTARAQQAHRTERWLLDRHEDAVVLRFGGLYRQGRGPAAAARRSGVREGPPNRTLPLLHYDDAASIALAALLHPAPQPCYLALTPPCPSRAEFYGALGLPATFTEPVDEPAADYDVALLRRDLLPSPAFPDWRSALA